MARVPRGLIIEEGFQVHKMWRSHNTEWNIASDKDKEAYWARLNKLLPKQPNVLNAFGTMSNHDHQIYDLKDKKKFSDLMRDHHSYYGMYFNRQYKRRGKVAYDRPKTCLLQDDEHSMIATFYVHANPLRAGINKNAANYRWSTHKLYAFGKRESFMKNVRFPQWYMKLGKTWSLRQKRYRQLFDAYLREQGLIKQDFLEKNFFGSTMWTEEHSERISDWRKESNHSPPDDDEDCCGDLP